MSIDLVAEYNKDTMLHRYHLISAEKEGTLNTVALS